MSEKSAVDQNPQIPVGVVLIAPAVALCVGIGLALLREWGIYGALGLLGLGAIFLVLGPIAYRLIGTLGVVPLALACALFWFSALEFIVGTKFGWVQLYRGVIIRVQGIGAGMFILPFAFLFLLKLSIFLKSGRGIDFLGLLLLAFVIVGSLTMLVGVLRQNSLGYVIGDTYKFVFPFIVYITCVVGITQLRQQQFLWKFMLLNGLFMSTLGMLFQLYKFMVGWPYSLLGKDIDVFALSASVLLFASHPKRKVRWGALLATIILCLGAIVSLERRDWLYVILVWIFALVLKKGKSRLRLIWLAIGGGGVFVIILLILGLVLPEVLLATTMSVERRLDRTLEQREEDSSVTRRLDEARYVMREFEKVPQVHLLIGLGQGAEFYDRLSGKSELGGSRRNWVHNVHNTYVSNFFRTGALGSFIVISFIFLSVKLALSCAHHTRKQGNLLDLLFLQAAVVTLLIQFGVTWNVAPSMGEIPVLAIVGLLGATRRRQLKFTRSQRCRYG